MTDYAARGATVRAARAADAAALGRFAEAQYRDVFVHGDFDMGYDAAELEAFLAASYAPEKTAAWIADPRGLVLVAEDAAGALIAYVHAGDNTLPLPAARNGDGELKRLYVEKGWRGAGLGARLFADALTFLGARTIYIGVYSENVAAQRFYARAGFAVVGEYGYAVGKTIDREFIMGRAA